MKHQSEFIPSNIVDTAKVLGIKEDRLQDSLGKVSC